MPTEIRSEKISHAQAQIMHQETFLAWCKAETNWSFARFMLSRGHQEYEQHLQPTQEALERTQQAWEAAELAFILTGIEESLNISFEGSEIANQLSRLLESHQSEHSK